MSGPTRRSEQGYVSVYVAIVASLVLVPLVLLMIDLTTLAYWRTKLRNIADAVAIGAVSETRNFHIPIPTKVVAWVPVEGVLLSGINLKNVEAGLPADKHSKVKEKLSKLVHLNRDAQPKASISLGKAVVQPVGNFVSPFMYVKVPVTGKVKLQTPYLARLLGKQGGKSPEVTLKAQSCSLAWYRVDHWFHPWSVVNPKSVADSLDVVIKLKDQPRKYYRLVNCAKGAEDLVTLAELAITEHLRMQGKDASDPWGALNIPDAKKFLARWKGEEKPTAEMKKRRDTLKNGLPEECQPGDPCIDSDGSAGDWVEKEQERNKAEEEAEKARREAAKKAAQQADQPDGQ